MLCWKFLCVENINSWLNGSNLLIHTLNALHLNGKKFSVGNMEFLREEAVLFWLLLGFMGQILSLFPGWPQSLLSVMILSALRESIWCPEHHPWLDSAPGGCHAGPSLSSNAELCLGFQQCPYLWSFRQAKPLTSSWPLQPRTVSGAIPSLPWYPRGQRRWCSNESLMSAPFWSVKDGLPLSVFVRIVAIL